MTVNDVEEGSNRLSRATSVINGRVMIQYVRSGVPSRILRWPTAISSPPIVLLSFSTNCAVVILRSFRT